MQVGFGLGSGTMSTEYRALNVWGVSTHDTIRAHVIQRSIMPHENTDLRRLGSEALKMGSG